MTRRNSLLPRPIKPENIDLGDTVRVTYSPDKGVTRVMVGRVSMVDYSGQNRHVRTAEGGTLCVWSPYDRSRSYTLELVARADVPQTPMFSMFEDLQERIA